MRIAQGLEGLRELPAGSVITIGNFDGVHRGHAAILRACRGLANERPGSAVAAVTFEPHPMSVIRPEAAPPRLTQAAMKEALLAEAGVDWLVVLAPAPGVLNLTAEEFWSALRDQGHPSWLVEGPEFNFGKGRGGNIDLLRQWTAQSGVGLHIVPPVQVVLGDLSVVRASSSMARWLLAHGRARDAAVALGRPYPMEGIVVEGFRRGRTLGIPTANLRPEQLVPADGVYVGRCAVDGTTYPAALSIGRLPTFAEEVRQVEAHLVGFSGDLYGRRIVVEVLDWVRDQMRFPSVEQLKQRMVRDIDWVVKRQGMDPAMPVVPT